MKLRVLSWIVMMGLVLRAHRLKSRAKDFYWFSFTKQNQFNPWTIHLNIHFLRIVSHHSSFHGKHRRNNFFREKTIFSLHIRKKCYFCKIIGFALQCLCGRINQCLKLLYFCKAYCILPILRSFHALPYKSHAVGLSTRIHSISHGTDHALAMQ